MCLDACLSAVLGFRGWLVSVLFVFLAVRSCSCHLVTQPTARTPTRTASNFGSRSLMNTKDDDDVDDTMESFEPSKSEPLIGPVVVTVNDTPDHCNHTGIRVWSQTQERWLEAYPDRQQENEPGDGTTKESTRLTHRETNSGEKRNRSNNRR